MTYPGNSLRRELENRWELDIPEYEYSPIDRDAQEQRFLILHPCPGDKSDPQNHVRCSIEVRPLAKAGPFIAIRDSRGYRLLRDVIEIDGKGLVVPVALEVFLRYFRGHRLPVTLWVRHICLEEFSSAEDQKEYWTRDFLDSMYARATQVVSMTEVVTELLERGIVEERIQSKYRK
ncbi:heterokaryon incompatibility protein [Colletotrichum abscissum]|uniref:Heterokaryon incompatibility protein n=1 Tax=Colletotrichum abscissum TaxID=1671311 RepID=A0A9Q0B8L2_9PEZI|nr:heterokaryon incompatibility protein [Colletotrichum abscissum]KAI3559520.1 heterokaryon incompatibility protein [Colletotrichum abscissum]KAK1476704.1 heterokaryon incompatibility protein [Colletotrichum abscissum]